MKVCDGVALTVPLHRDVEGFDMSKMVEGTECFYCEFTCACGCVECRREARKGRGVKWECEVEVVPNCNEGVDSVGLTWCPFGSRGGKGRRSFEEGVGFIVVE